MGRSNKKNICKMNIEIVRDYKKLINEKFDDFVRGLIEKYQEEISKLQDVIITSSNLIKEKEILMEELQKELEENKFEEANFNNVSLIKNLTKQVDELKNQNNLLNISLSSRDEKKPKKSGKKKKKLDNDVESHQENEDEVTVSQKDNDVVDQVSNESDLQEKEDEETTKDKVEDTTHVEVEDTTKVEVEDTAKVEVEDTAKVEVEGTAKDVETIEIYEI